MADDDVDVTLRLKAVDETSRVLDDASRRSQAFLSQFNQGLKANTDATTKLIAATTSLATNTTAAGQAMQGAAAATAKHTAAMQSGVATAGKFAGGLLSLNEAIEIVTTGYRKFAESQRSMERIQAGTDATTADMDRLGRTISNLSALSGEAGSSLRQTFSAFREQTDLSVDEATVAFDRIGKAANVIGVPVEDMSRIAVAAITNLKVSGNEISAMFDNMAATIPSSMIGVFAQAMPRLTQELHGFGITGRQAAEELGIAFTNIAVSFGGNARQATQVLQDLFQKAYDISSPLGAQ